MYTLGELRAAMRKIELDSLHTYLIIFMLICVIRNVMVSFHPFGVPKLAEHDKVMAMVSRISLAEAYNVGSRNFQGTPWVHWGIALYELGWESCSGLLPSSRLLLALSSHKTQK